HRVFVSRRCPMPRLPPQPRTADQRDQQQRGGDTPPPGECPLASHFGFAAPLVQALIWSTQMSVKSRRAVAKSVSALPAIASSNCRVARPRTARRALSGGSISPGEALRDAL